jgi:hypothetical protein
MHQPRLRIYCGPQDEGSTVNSHQSVRDTVNVPLGEVFSLLADAVGNQRTWLRDFEDDEITIPADLYGVILTYRHYRRPSA